MKQKQTTNQESRNKNDHNYSGKFSDQQTNGNSFRGRRYQGNSLNDYQNFLYNRAVYGLNVYSKESIEVMRWDKKERIIKVNNRAKKVLNLWKQEIVNKCSTRFFESLFPRSLITKSMIKTTNITDPEYVNKMSFHSLRVTKAQVISKLVAEGILPPNFYELKTIL